MVTGQCPLRVIIDGLDNLSDESGGRSRPWVWLPPILPPHVTMLVSTSTTGHPLFAAQLLRMNGLLRAAKRASEGPEGPGGSSGGGGGGGSGLWACCGGGFTPASVQAMDVLEVSGVTGPAK